MNKALLVLLLLSSAAVGETYYIPIVDSPIVAEGIPPGGGVYVTKTGWHSTLSAFNPTDNPLAFSFRAIYGGDAHFYPGCTAPSQLTPHLGFILHDFGPCFFSPSDGGPGFVEVETGPGLLLAASVQRVFFRCQCYSLDCTPITLGESNLPVYKGLFSKNSTAYTGQINLGAPQLPLACGSPEEQNLRRVNITLFNAGREEALFTIRVLPARMNPEPITGLSVRLGPNEVRQLNKVAIPYVTDESVNVGSDGLRVWISVTADQPFLYYVSTPFDTTSPGAISVQVFEAKVVTP